MLNIPRASVCECLNDKIAAAVIQATQGGLTESVADTMYLRLDGTNSPTVDYHWDSSLTLDGGTINFNSVATAYIKQNVVSLVSRTKNANGKLGIEGAITSPNFKIYKLDENDEEVALPMRGAYSDIGNAAGYFVTDTYLNSDNYKSAAPFVKKTGDTMSGVLGMGGNKISGVGEIIFGNEESNVCGIYGAGDSEHGYTLYVHGKSNLNKATITNLRNPERDFDAVNLAYLKQYCEGKTQEVTLTGVVDTILAHNTEYTIKDFTALTLVCDNAKTAENHGYIRFPNVPVVPTLTGFSGIDGDDITQAAANEVWEFSCFKGYMLFKNWGVAA